MFEGGMEEIGEFEEGLREEIGELGRRRKFLFRN